MHFNQIDQTTFGDDQGQILTMFYEGVNANVFSLHFFCNAKKQIPGTYIHKCIKRQNKKSSYRIFTYYLDTNHMLSPGVKGATASDPQEQLSVLSTGKNPSSSQMGFTVTHKTQILCPHGHNRSATGHLLPQRERSDG